MLVAEKKITVREFRQIEFDGEDAYYELINGQIVKKAAPTPLHQEISQNLNFEMSYFVRKKQLGKVFTAPTDVYLDKYNHHLPDLFFIRADNLGIIDYKHGILGVPDLIVEILSPGTAMNDRVEKKSAYLATGVREYWLIDPQRRSVEILENRGVFFETIAFFEGEGKVKSEVLKGFEVEISTLFPVR